VLDSVSFFMYLFFLFSCCFFFFFFFQAEDGIRDPLVTGVQTCALPISSQPTNNYAVLFVGWEGVGLCSYLLIGFYFHRKSASDRSEERRVGKECRSRRSAYH